VLLLKWPELLKALSSHGAPLDHRRKKADEEAERGD
jgi:hypothetical protein